MVEMVQGNIVVNINLIKTPLLCAFKSTTSLQICGNIKRYDFRDGLSILLSQLLFLSKSIYLN